MSINRNNSDGNIKNRDDGGNGSDNDEKNTHDKITMDDDDSSTCKEMTVVIRP